METTRTMYDMGIEVPFQHTLQLLGPQGEIVRIVVLFYGCAMVSVMCATIFEKVKHRLGEWRKSVKQMGNGVVIPSPAVWRGKMQLSRVTVEGEFEVFNSRGSWAFFLGKLFQAMQDYETDSVSIYTVASKTAPMFAHSSKIQTLCFNEWINV